MTRPGAARHGLQWAYALAPDALKSAVLRRHLSRALPRPGRATPRLTLEQRPEPVDIDGRVVATRSGRELTLGADWSALFRDSWKLNRVWKRLPVMVHFLGRTSEVVREATANITDGVDVRADELAFCSRVSDAILVPDRGFMRPRHYRPFRALAERDHPPWSARRDVVLWRGTSSSPGRVPTPPLSIDDLTLGLRIRLCLVLRDVAGTDVRLSAVVREADARERPALAEAGVLAEGIAPERWIDVRYAIDVDGVTNAWSNLFTRLLLGCCVLKVDSPAGYAQWYYDELEPWRHYVPVSSDLSDLVERIEWCRANPARSEEIANEGQRFARARTPESETPKIVAEIERRLGS
jgi:hypothetical protein